MKEAVDDMMVTLNEAASEVGMMTKSVTSPDELGALASQVTVDYSQLAVQGRLAAHTAEPEEVRRKLRPLVTLIKLTSVSLQIGFQIKSRVQELGHGCIFLVQKAGALQISPSDSFTKRELIDCARAVTEKVSLVLSALQAGNKGTQACITAASAVSGIIADLDTTIMFASAGTLNAENDEENILKTAKALVEDTKMLVSGAASGQDKLAQAAQSSAKTITQLTDVVKLGAASIGSDDPETQFFQSKDAPNKTTTPEEFIRMTKGITIATAKAVAAGNSAHQEDIIHTANLSRKVVSDMLTTCKVKPTAEQKQHLAACSKRVAGAVTELIQTAEAMKGTEWVDPEDPTVIAETELLGAAASIEAAAKKLEQLKPRAKPKQADETLNFEEQILEAAKSIAAATSALVKSASAAQRELVAQGKVGSIPANAVDDGQWSQGLISAARMVAAATSNLCEAANASVQGHASEEKLISSAKQVAASTAQLLVACKVKADQDSEAMRRLQVCS
ncbi:Talin-2 [Goodea atripinnis]|uniref:Talin-2 n=1 Tax=Goodea atripinnis TaxID=208336 RepID=A0ABV0P6T1_9TELE